VPGAAGGDTPRQDPGRSPTTSWPLWTVPVVLIGALIVTTIASLLIDIPAAALGATVTGSHISPGVQIADTFIQDVCFVLVSIWFAQLGGRKVASWQFGLRRPPRGWWRAIGLIGLLIACFLVLIAVWQEAFNPSREKLLEELGTNEGAALLVLSAALTCIVAPISEEFLFRGYIFTALRNWRGTLPAALITGLIFGGVHAGSAPALDLIPLAGLGFGLCLLYRYTGSLYPCFAAHALNNCVAFGSLEGWDWQVPLLIAGSLAGITCVVVLFKRIGLIADAAAEQSLTAAVP
jgi:membrane protease YdiL (CAAX protease family)